MGAMRESLVLAGLRRVNTVSRLERRAASSIPVPCFSIDDRNGAALRSVPNARREDEMTSRSIATVLAVLAIAAVPLAASAGCDDPAAAEAVRAQITSVGIDGPPCVCTEATNHGQYVSCFTRAIRAAVRDGLLPTNCKGVVTRCAARSTCGKKAGFVTCCFASPGTCTDGLCQDGATPCMDATQCPVVTRCRTKSSSDHCVAAGGSPGTGSCCDAVCSLP
jgi:hypothetical protein